MSTPYVCFGNETLDKLPEVREGDIVKCDKCGEGHKLECGTSDGKKSDVLMFYKCGENTYLGAIDGKCVVNV